MKAEERRSRRSAGRINSLIELKRTVATKRGPRMRKVIVEDRIASLLQGIQYRGRERERSDVFLHAEARAGLASINYAAVVRR